MNLGERILPVLDVRDRQVVHAVSGERKHYRPVASVFAPSALPLEVARAIRERFGSTLLYLADLDAIEGSAPPAWNLYRDLLQDGFQLWADAGVRDRASALEVARVGVHGVVAASETLTGSGELRAILWEVGHERTIFSLDLRYGAVLSHSDDWNMGGDPVEAAGEVVRLGVRRLIVLELATVGTGGGCPLGALVRRIRGLREDLEIVAGGGVRDVADVANLLEAGASAVLVATALHRGTILPGELETPGRNQEQN